SPCPSPIPAPPQLTPPPPREDNADASRMDEPSASDCKPGTAHPCPSETAREESSTAGGACCCLPTVVAGDLGMASLFRTDDDDACLREAARESSAAADIASS
ncbi:unnamed protein product, partial [Ectocarpus sp. 12 AP-2014]